MTFLRPRQIKSGYHPEEQTPQMVAEIAGCKATISAVTLFALAGSFEFDDVIIAARVNELAAVASEFGASPDDMQEVLVTHDEDLAISKQSEWQQRWGKNI